MPYCHQEVETKDACRWTSYRAHFNNLSTFHRKELLLQISVAQRQWKTVSHFLLFHVVVYRSWPGYKLFYFLHVSWVCCLHGEGQVALVRSLGLSHALTHRFFFLGLSCCHNIIIKLYPLLTANPCQCINNNYIYTDSSWNYETCTFSMFNTYEITTKLKALSIQGVYLKYNQLWERGGKIISSRILDYIQKLCLKK